jgi:flagellar hook assembly protein FlgD
LEPGFPNPFNPETVFAFRIPEAGLAVLEVYDVRGQLVRVLLEGRLEPGRHEAVWDGREQDGRPVPSGIYLVRLTAGRSCRIQRTALLR